VSIVKKKIIKGNRRGPLSEAEKKTIDDLLIKYNDVDISRKLKRSPEQIAEYRKKVLSKAPEVEIKRSEAEEFKRELHTNVGWHHTKLGLNDIEIDYFENKFVEYRQQFGALTPTEATQTFQMINLEINLNRHNAERMASMHELSRLQTLLDKLYKKDPFDQSPEDLVQIKELEIIIQTTAAAGGAKTKEHSDILKQHQAILKDLKGTRDQRIKNLEDRGKFIGLLKDLEVAERREEIGEIMGLMDLAISKEEDRLAQPYQFMDQMVDQPLLNYKTVQLDEEE
jgi:hypothetical protein